MSDALVAAYLIGLREGLEATLVVSILVAYLVKSQRRDRLPLVWSGVGAAVALSIGFGALLSYTTTSILSTYESRELFEAIASLLAVVFVTWMIFWMRGAARSIAGELRAKLGGAVAIGGVAVAMVAFLSVAREGLETALLFFSAAQGSTDATGPLLAIAGGIVTAVVLGVLLYQGAVRVNLTTFFTWTGALLVLVAAGILKYSVHDFQEAGVLPGGSSLAFDVTNVLDPNSWYGSTLEGMFNITGDPSWFELIAWLAYGVPVLTLFLWRRSAPAPAPKTTDQPVPTPEGVAS